MKAQCVICYGLTRMTDVAGVYHLGELDIRLARYDSPNITCPLQEVSYNWSSVYLSLNSLIFYCNYCILFDRIYLNNSIIQTT